MQAVDLGLLCAIFASSMNKRIYQEKRNSIHTPYIYQLSWQPQTEHKHGNTLLMHWTLVTLVGVYRNANVFFHEYTYEIVAYKMAKC